MVAVIAFSSWTKIYIIYKRNKTQIKYISKSYEEQFKCMEVWDQLSSASYRDRTYLMVNSFLF